LAKPKKPKRKPSRARPGWYQLVSYFKDADLEATPIAGAFFRGVLEEMVIVEVPKNFHEEKLGELAVWLENNGIKAMVVQEGIRFLKIKPATADQRAVLEAHHREEQKQKAALAQEPAPGVEA
jgi:hypothetical protein